MGAPYTHGSVSLRPTVCVSLCLCSPEIFQVLPVMTSKGHELSCDGDAASSALLAGLRIRQARGVQIPRLWPRAHEWQVLPNITNEKCFSVPERLRSGHYTGAKAEAVPGAPLYTRTKVIRYPASIWEMTASILSSPTLLAHIPYRYPG